MTLHDEVPDTLRPFLVADQGGEEVQTLNPSEAAAKLKVTLDVVAAWIDAKRLLAWHDEEKHARVPAEQILGPGEIVPGLTHVLELISEPRLAWAFLSQELPFFDTPQRPIDALKAGQIAAVIAAIPAYFEAFT